MHSDTWLVERAQAVYRYSTVALPWQKPMSWKRGMRAMVTSLPDLLRLAVLCSSTLTILFLMGTCATSGSFRSQVSEPSSSACFKGLVCFWLPMFTCDSQSDRPHSAHAHAHLLCVSAEYDGSCRSIPCQLSLLTGTCMKLLTAVLLVRMYSHSFACWSVW